MKMLLVKIETNGDLIFGHNYQGPYKFPTRRNYGRSVCCKALMEFRRNSSHFCKYGPNPVLATIWLHDFRFWAGLYVALLTRFHMGKRATQSQLTDVKE
jgi:hypothetical protein